MKLVSYVTTQCGCPSGCLGALVEGRVYSLDSVAHTMRQLLDGGDETMAAARKAAEHPGNDTLIGELSEVTLLPPVSEPRKLFALAGNYASHIRESRRVKAVSIGEPKRSTPRVFLKPPSTTLIGPKAPIKISRLAQFIDYEVELAVVIGRRGKYLKAEDAHEYVAGYTILNDISERRLRIREREESTEWDRFFDWLNGKWMDSFAPMGPCLVTADELGDPQALGIGLRLNGETMQDDNTANMIWGVADLIEYISSLLTLEPGDVISMGTPGGVGFARTPPRALQPGDLVEAEIAGIGVLANPVEADEN